jgi:dipeptidase E
MKYYLSSYRIGNKAKELLKLAPKRNKTIALIPNALDYLKDLEQRKKSLEENKAALEKLGFNVILLDLRKYFKKKDSLKKIINKCGAVFVRGGNTFVLRQAMKLSGLDNIITKIASSKRDFLYAGYSAGICILAPSLKGIELVDDVKEKPYKFKKTIWEGLGFLDYYIVPHYKSKHPESASINKVVKYYISKNMSFKTLKDGEVIIIK